MKWNHLPLPGGLYAQDPKLIDQFEILFHEEALERKRQDDKNNPKPKPR